MRFKIATVLVLILSIFSLTAMPALGVTYNDLIQAEKEKKRLQEELNEQKDKSRNLSEEIAYTENQIRLNELEIQDTQGQIQATQKLIIETNSKINDLSRKLDVLDETMQHMQEVAEARIRDAYKQSRTPEFGVLVRSGSFADAMKTYEYLKALEAEDARVLALVSENQKNYGEEKDNLEALKAEKESLNQQLKASRDRIEIQQSELDSARNYKDQLLAQSQGEESRYAQLLAQNEARIASMRRILSGGGIPGQNLGYFNQGEVVGLMGSTGCSTGAHLHFGVISGGGFVDPWNYIGGSMIYPVNRSQTYLSGDYNAVSHNGIDFASNNGQTGLPLYATKAGSATLEIAYTKQQILDSYWCPVKWAVNSDQWEIWLRHTDGTISVYAHVLP